MKIKVLTILAGPDYSAQPGEILELPLPMARVLVDGGYAVFVDEAAPPPAVLVEDGRMATGENTTGPRQRGRK